MVKRQVKGAKKCVSEATAMVKDLQKTLAEVLTQRERSFMNTNLDKVEKDLSIMRSSIDSVPAQMDPITSFLSGQRFLGVTSEKHMSMLDEFIKKQGASESESEEMRQLLALK